MRPHASARHASLLIPSAELAVTDEGKEGMPPPMPPLLGSGPADAARLPLLPSAQDGRQVTSTTHCVCCSAHARSKHVCVVGGIMWHGVKMYVCGGEVRMG